MSKVYSAPKEIAIPKLDFSNMAGYREAQKAYIQQVKDWAKKNSKDELAGEELRFPIADGYAQYIVFSTKPVQLIHLEIGDAWDAPLAHRLLKKDVIEQIESNKRLDAMFSKKSV